MLQQRYAGGTAEAVFDVSRELPLQRAEECTVSVIVPTYNEAENIRVLIPSVHGALRGYSHEIIVVDDSSPDGTAEAAEELAEDFPVRVLVRNGKLGLASAILYGFKKARGEILGVIDADLQHPPEYIGRFVEKVNEGYDIVIGSRYVEGGRIEGWSLKRRIISMGAIMLAKPLAFNVKDPMSGYFFLKKHVIEDVDFNLTGYKLLLEILVKGKYDKVVEIPYIFRNRVNGKSKLKIKEILEYTWLLCDLYHHKIFR